MIPLARTTNYRHLYHHCSVSVVRSTPNDLTNRCDTAMRLDIAVSYAQPCVTTTQRTRPEWLEEHTEMRTHARRGSDLVLADLTNTHHQTALGGNLAKQFIDLASISSLRVFLSAHPNNKARPSLAPGF